MRELFILPPTWSAAGKGREENLCAPCPDPCFSLAGPPQGAAGRGCPEAGVGFSGVAMQFPLIENRTFPPPALTGSPAPKADDGKPWHWAGAAPGPAGATLQPPGSRPGPDPAMRESYLGRPQEPGSPVHRQEAQLRHVAGVMRRDRGSARRLAHWSLEVPGVAEEKLALALEMCPSAIPCPVLSIVSQGGPAQHSI